MLSSQEIRPGNLVRINTNITEEFKPVDIIVKAINKEQDLEFVSFGIGSIWVGNLEGVPANADFIEKVKHKIAPLDTANELSRLPYVHQIQNYFHFLTGEELTELE